MSKPHRIMATLSCVGAFLACLSAAQANQPQDDRQALSSATGSMATNSRDGALLRTAPLAPGDRAHGTVTLTASDQAPVEMDLAQTAVRDRPGRYGGTLSSVLQLSIIDVTDPREPLRVYRGKLRDLRTQRLQQLAAGEHRTFRFSVLFPDGGTPPSPTTGDNAYQGSSVQANFRWTSHAT